MNRHYHFKVEIHHYRKLAEMFGKATTRHEIKTFYALPDCRHSTFPFLRKSEKNTGVSAFPAIYINIS